MVQARIHLQIATGACKEIHREAIFEASNLLHDGLRQCPRDYHLRRRRDAARQQLRRQRGLPASSPSSPPSRCSHKPGAHPSSRASRTTRAPTRSGSVLAAAPRPAMARRPAVATRARNSVAASTRGSRAARHHSLSAMAGPASSTSRLPHSAAPLRRTRLLTR